MDNGTVHVDSPGHQHEDPEPAQDDSTAASEAALACNCCRRRKLRCSREVPACQQCRKTGSDCVYESKRAKPGMKAGAIENLHRRLDALEQTVQQQQQQQQQATRSDRDRTSSQATPQRDVPPELNKGAYGILSFFAREFQRFNERPSLAYNTDSYGDVGPARSGHGPSPKRRRIDTDDGLSITSLPDDDAMDAILRAYFSHVHPWIPMIHEGRLRRRLSHPEHQKRLHLVLHSMILVASRYIEEPNVAAAMTASPEQRVRARDWIIAQAMRDLSVENLQALIMISFNDIGNGEASQAWSLIGSLTRTVEYLQLTVEGDETERLSVSQPFASLPAPLDWTEAEERRRVFWNVFNLDRFCSVTMGWNTSLTSDDVSRRLPCDGIAWRKEDSVDTPFFGIWDKAAGRIGNPIAFLPSHYAAHSQAKDEDAQTPSEATSSPAAPSSTIDMSTVGAFAYSIEATESLSRVNSYFLQQRVNMRDSRDLTSWLTRFKELDLRLVHWKMFLPQKWKANMARQTSRMDPNLTLAHVTHNASMILLHQVMAFPPPEWTFRNRLPSILSVDTCQAAAVEIATITRNYLKNALPTVPASSQLAFCLYVAAKVLLLHWQYSSTDSLAPDFWSLVQSLEEMARRWAGPHLLEHDRTIINLAAKYSRKLTEFHNRCLHDESFRVGVLGYTTDIDHSSSHSTPPPPPTLTAGAREAPREDPTSIGPKEHTMMPRPNPEHEAQHPISVGNSGLPPTFGLVQPPYPPQGVSMNFPPAPNVMQAPSPLAPNSNMHRSNSYHRGSTGSGELGAISQLLMDQQFMDMDRVISYDDGMFAAEYEDYEGGTW